MKPLGSERDKPPHFAGRKRELRELARRLDCIRATSDPSGGMALIDGVQGSGKTQLLAEFVARAKAADANVAHLDMTTADIPTTAKEMVGEIAFALSMPRRKILAVLDARPKLKGAAMLNLKVDMERPSAPAPSFARLMRRTQDAGWWKSKALIVTVDEVQTIAPPHRGMLRLLHEGRYGCPLMLVCAGLQHAQRAAGPSARALRRRAQAVEKRVDASSRSRTLSVAKARPRGATTLLRRQGELGYVREVVAMSSNEPELSAWRSRGRRRGNLMTAKATVQLRCLLALATGRISRLDSLSPLPLALMVGALVAFAAFLDPTAVAAAEEAEALDEDEMPIEEIVVTATYRDTLLMDTPITISAVTDVEIVQKGIQDIHTLYTSIPGFNYKSSTLAYNILSVRGITPFAGGPSPVGAYMDNVPMGSTRGDSGHLRGPLFDIERVEVLKGPQGTLYGEGAMGGAIRYITKQPDPTGVDFTARAAFESMAHSNGIGHRINGVLNMPLGELAAARLVLYSRDQKGLIDAPGLRAEEDVNWTEETGARLTVAVQASDMLRLTAMLNVVNAEMGAPGIAFHCYDVLREDVNLVEVPDYPSPGVDCRGDHNAQFGRDPYVTHKTHPAVRGLDGGFDDTTIFNLGAEWQLPFAELIVSASYLDQEWQYDEEAPPHVAFLKGLVEGANCFGALGDGICNVPGRYSSQIVYGLVHRWTERYAYEARMVSTGEGPLKWTLGAYYKDDDYNRGDHSPCSSLVPYSAVAPNEPCFIQWLFHPDTPVDHQAMIANWLNTNIFPGNSSFGYTQERSVFGEVSYRLNEQWEITAGLRSADVIVSVNTLLDGSDDPNDIESTFTLDDDRKTSPKVTLTWRPADDWMIYGTWSHGFRPGIVQDRLISAVARLDAVRATNADAEALYQQLVDAQTVNGDEAVSMELGLKATLADGRLSVTGALYNIEWEDIIVRTSATTPDIPGIVPFPLTYDDNAGTASSQGLELELRGILADSWGWALGGSFMWEADIGTASTGNVARVAGSTSVGVQPGNRLPASPEFSGYASLVRDFRLGGFDAVARVDAYKVTEQFRGGDNERATPGYKTVDVRLLLTRGEFETSFYVRNVFDEVVAYERNQQGYVFGRARTLGVEFNYNP